jgi:hypothetical protein
MEFLVNVQVTVDVQDAEAVRRAAREMCLPEAGRTSADEQHADEATKTTAHAVGVILAGPRVLEALVGAVHPIPDLTMTGIYVQADWVEPLN